MQNWWQHLPETISPVIFTIGSFQLRWYGLMYVVAFMMVYLLVMRRYQIDDIKLDKEAIQSWQDKRRPEPQKSQSKTIYTQPWCQDLSG